MVENTPEAWKTGEIIEHYDNLFPFAEKEIEEYLATLHLNENDIFIDFGCGGGAAMKAAAKYCRKVIGVDISEQQLARAQKLLDGLKNVKLIHASFLDCDLGEEEQPTAGAARKAFHHLTDAEKIEFFTRMGPKFAKNARFVIEDAIFDFDRSELQNKMPQILAEAEVWYGRNWPQVREDVLSTLCDEYATGLNVWNQALKAGGFEISERKRHTCFLSRLTAVKKG